MTKVIIFGSFDPLHPGHLNFFQQARALGDYLIIVVASDDKIRSRKGHEPRFDETERLRAVTSAMLADEVILGESAEDYTILDSVKPDIVALGYDQKIPEPLQSTLSNYKTVLLEPFKPEVYKSSLVSSE